MATARIHIGVDVSKDKLDVFVPGEKERFRQVPNTLKDARRMVRGITAAIPGAMFCCESTGGYENTLLDACRREGAPCCRMNAQQAHSYAAHLGTLEKTDRIDARMISLAADSRKPGPLAHPTDRQGELKDACVLREQLIAHRDSLRCQLGHTGGKGPARIAGELIRTVERKIARLEELCRRLVAEDAADQALLERYTLAKGAGTLTAVAMIALLPELRTLGDKALGKLAGIAPLCAQSGTRDAPRHIQKGRGRARRALYWAALPASAHNSILSAYYRKLADAGKPKKVAIVAVMHKLLRLLRRSPEPGLRPQPRIAPGRTSRPFPAI
jgi:Transposase and inactivated derivatives